MNRTEKLAVLASVLAAAALAAGCVPSLNYGSVPPEPKYTTKVTTTTATSATKKPFTTPKPRTGTISWEELNGPQVYVTRARSTETAAIYTGYGVVGEAVGMSEVVRRRGDYDLSESGDGQGQTAVQVTEPPVVQTEAPPQTAPPQTEPPQTAPPEVYVPPQQDVTPDPVPDVSPQPGPPEPAGGDEE